MDELLAQFLVESRELLERGGAALAALESAPGDERLVDDVFRALHTLKGGAGIVDFAAMEALLHDGENVLAAARSRTLALEARDIDDLLRCLDQVARWLDTIESTGALPSGPAAEAQAQAIAARLARRGGIAPRAPSGARAAGDWLARLCGAHPDAAPQARTALRYEPTRDAFFRDVDPLAVIARLPELLAVDVAAQGAWPRLDELEPFASISVYTALLGAPLADVAAALGEEAAHCDIRALDIGAKPAALTSAAREILEAQLAMLADADPRYVAGCAASAAVVAARVLRQAGAAAAADAAQLAAEAAAAGNAPPATVAARVSDAIAAVLTGGTKAELPEADRDSAPTPAAVSQAEPGTPVPLRLDGRARTLRVDAGRLDALLRLAGELAVAKNAIGHTVQLARKEDSSLSQALGERHAVLHRLVVELERAVLAMRVLPLRVAFQRFPRLIREMSGALGKPAELFVAGENTEADKTIVENLVEPLLHVLRNAMDHGIEAPAARAAAGKPAVATIRLSASRRGERLVVEVSDDGAGVDVARVRGLARERGLITGDAAAKMSDAEVVGLIFAPGLSTAETVTDVSGRGVGMDAVRTAAARLGGTVEAESSAGHGTTVRFSLPFSLLMTRVLTVQAGGQPFGIPLDAVVETISVPQADIHRVGTARALVIRDRTVPLLDLAQLLGDPLRPRTRAESALVVVTRTDDEIGALQVDRIGEPMEVMLKPLEALLAGTPGIAGSALLGDGGILLVLDLAELLE